MAVSCPVIVQRNAICSGVSASSAGGDSGAALAIDCAICMDTLTFPMSRRDYMVTPCDHLFHAPCLRQWFQHKLECPTCRMPLPEPGAEPTPTLTTSAPSATAGPIAAPPPPPSTTAANVQRHGEA